MNIHLKIPSVDFLILLLSMAAAIASSLWYGIAGASSKRGIRAAANLGTPYVAAVKPWLARPHHEWISESGFDFFAPPRKPGAELPLEPAKDESFGIELVAIRPEPFCVRLLGIIGDGPERRGVFEDVSSGEIRLCRPGDTIPQRVRIQSLECHGIVATSLVQTPGSNRPLELSAGSPAYSDERIATIHDPGGSREVRVGDTVATPTEKYQVERIAPAAITLRRESVNGGMPERRELQLPEAEERP